MSDPQICVSLDSVTVDGVKDEAVRANLAGADMIELRFDRLFLNRPEPIEIASDEEEGETKKVMPDENDWQVSDFSDLDVSDVISQLKEAIPLPVVFTCRPVREGGFFPGTEEERISVLEAAIDSGVSWVDLELSMEEDTRKELKSKADSGSTKVICSIHDTEGTPASDDIANMVKENKDSGDVVKICTTARDHQDALQLVEAAGQLKEMGLNHSLMALNSGGDWLRLHAPIFDQSIVYATMKNEFRLSDKGLVNVRDLKDAWSILEY